MQSCWNVSFLNSLFVPEAHLCGASLSQRWGLGVSSWPLNSFAWAQPNRHNQQRWSPCWFLAGASAGSELLQHVNLLRTGLLFSNTRVHIRRVKSLQPYTLYVSRASMADSIQRDGLLTCCNSTSTVQISFSSSADQFKDTLHKALVVLPSSWSG